MLEDFEFSSELPSLLPPSKLAANISFTCKKKDKCCKKYKKKDKPCKKCPKF